MDKINISLTVIVPFYNEEKFLSQSLERLAKIDSYNEIILVDDCSTDNSYKIAENFANNHENISLYKKTTNEGKGSCIIYVKKFVRTTHVIVHDADLEYDPKDITKLFEISKNYSNSIISGSRTIGNGKRTKKYRSLKYINFILTSLFSLLNFCKISDIASCYILMPTKFLKKHIYEESGFGLEVEILSKFLRTNNKIIETPINYHGRSYSEGKKIKIKDGINIFLKIFKYSKILNPNSKLNL